MGAHHTLCRVRAQDLTGFTRVERTQSPPSTEGGAHKEHTEENRVCACNNAGRDGRKQGVSGERAQREAQAKHDTACVPLRARTHRGSHRSQRLLARRCHFPALCHWDSQAHWKDRRTRGGKSGDAACT